MIYVFLKLRIKFILARRLAEVRQDRRHSDQYLAAFEQDQARVNARMAGLNAQEFRSNLTEWRRLNTNLQTRIETMQHSLKDCPANELRGLLETLFQPANI